MKSRIPLLRGALRRITVLTLFAGLAAGTATAQPVVIDPTTPLNNGGFEADPVLPDPWLPGGAVAVSTAQQRSGLNALELVAPGGFSVPTARQEFLTQAGDVWDFSGYMLTPATLPANATFGLLKIVWKDENGADLQPLTTDPELIGTALTGGNPGVESAPFLNNGSTVGAWNFSQARGTAPANTASVELIILLVDESAATIYADDITVLGTVRQPTPPKPPVLSVAVNGTDIDLTVETKKGKEYDFESAPDLSSTPTATGAPTVRGTGESETVTLSGATPTAGDKVFYFAVQDDLSPASGDILFNGDFSEGRSNIDGWEAFAIWNQPKGTFIFSSPWALPDAPVVAPGDNTATFGMNTQLAAADSFWEGGYQNPMTLQQAFWSPDGDKSGEVYNLYGQEVTFTGTLRITEAYGTNLVSNYTVTGGTTLPIASDTDYVVTGLNGNLSGTGASILVRRLADGTIAFVRWAENGSGFVVGETVTVPGSQIGGVDGTDDIVVTVDELSDNTIEIFIDCLDVNFVQTAESVSVDKTAQTVGVDVPFSLTTTVPASGLNNVTVGFRNTGVEGTPGEIRVSNLAFTVAPPAP